MAQRIEVEQGKSYPIEIAVTGTDYLPYQYAEGETLKFGVKKKKSDASCVILKKVTSCTDSVFLVSLEYSDTQNLAPGTYFYDVGLLSGSHYYPVIPASEFIIKDSVTKAGD